ncbi:MAG TPA: hypothetical protein VGC13_06500 [Longimicrobium sp.]|uniref:hypothetical protein n=1 Tax=Longimicrobium sp. TaxID=2029185 RepID=UPI002ED7AAB6
MRITRRCMFALGLCAAAAACDTGGNPAPRRAERTLTPARWNRVWTAGGTEADTTLLQPWRVAVGNGLVYVADKGGLRVAAFRVADGSLAWIRGGRGSGPGEFQLPTALAVDRRGILWVADARNSRMTLYRPDGSLHASVPLPDFPYPEAMCPLPGGGMLVATSAATEPLFRLSADGEIAGRMDLPWRDLAGAAPLSVQKLLAPTPEGCVLALALGRGFATLAERGARTFSYLEDLPLPRVEKTVDDGGTVYERVVGMRSAATSVTAEAGEIAISPGGEGALENRLVDFYRQRDGAYLRSISTPVPFQRMARAGELFFFLTHRDGYPALVAVRPEIGTEAAPPPSP